MNTETLNLILQKVEEMNIGEQAYLEFANMTKRYYENKRIEVKNAHEILLKSYLNVLNSLNDAEYWKKTPSKEKKEYLASVYGMNHSDQQYITERMNEHLKKAYKKFVNK